MKLIVSLFAAGCLLVLSAASPAIGFIKSTGEFRVDGSAIRNNGNVFEGNLIETTASRSVIQLGGIRITLSPESRARVFRDHTVLEKGTGSVTDGAPHVIEANTLRISPSNAAVVQIEITQSSHVMVATLGGSTDVRNASGILAAHLLPGTSLAFEPQAAASSAVSMTGKVTTLNGAYFLTDEISKVTVQIEGAEAAKYVGKKVYIAGSIVAGAKPAGSASQVVRAVTISAVTAKGKVAAAAAGAGTGTAAAGAAGAGGTAGISTTAVVAIVGGVAVAGTVGGLAAVGTFSSDSPVSRQ